MKINFEKFKKRNPHCFIPKEHIALIIYSNTNKWLRKYCYEMEKKELNLKRTKQDGVN